jgi:hypothetical protein
LISKNNVYDYSEDELFSSFDDFFTFCQDNLDLNTHGISPASFYYHQDFGINAGATMKNGHYFIGVFMGVIFKLNQLFEERKEIFAEDDFLKYKVVAGKNNISPQFLLFQITTLFFYYHEYGHLLQKSQNENFSFTENLQPTGNLNRTPLVSHVYELDADWYASNNIIFHLLQFAKGSENVIEKESLEAAISMGLAGIFTYFTLTSAEYASVYYEERSHPHPLIRISYIMQFAVEALSANTENDIGLNPQNIIKDSIKLAEALLIKEYGNAVENIGLKFLEEVQNIETYIQKIIAESENHLNLARIKLDAKPQ